MNTESDAVNTLAADSQLVRQHLAAVNLPAQMDAQQIADYKARIKVLLKEKDAVLVAHYYTDALLQELAEESGGFISDSLEMARFGRDAKQSTLVVAGVRFMGETASILSPDKTVLMPTLEAPVRWIWPAQSMTLQHFAMPTPIARSWSMPIPLQR